jgi:hypothetical protein
VVTIANYAAGQAGARVTGGGAPPRKLVLIPCAATAPPKADHGHTHRRSVATAAPQWISTKSRTTASRRSVRAGRAPPALPTKVGPINVGAQTSSHSKRLQSRAFRADRAKSVRPAGPAASGVWHAEHRDGDRDDLSRSRERGSLCGTTTIGGGESHSHCSWLGTPVRGRAQFDLSSKAAAGGSHIPEGPSCISSTPLQLRAV